MRKTYALPYPGILAVWKALDDAKQRGYRHLEFMDVGLPFLSLIHISLILQSGFFCNSDKYSLCFTMAHIPQSQRTMMLSQMTSQDLDADVYKRQEQPPLPT